MSDDGPDSGKEWFAVIMWDEMPEGAKDEIRESRAEQSGGER